MHNVLYEDIPNMRSRILCSILVSFTLNHQQTSFMCAFYNIHKIIVSIHISTSMNMRSLHICFEHNSR